MTGNLVPKSCEKNVSRLREAIGMSDGIAYEMLLMTALLMDLRPEDEQTADIVLEDCGLSPDAA